MSEYELLDAVCESNAFESTDAAERTIDATLRALGESLSAGERRDIAKHLPERYASTIREYEAESRKPLELDEFVERIGDEAGIDNPKPKVRIVLASLREKMGEDVISDARDQLPPEYGTLFEPASVEPGRTFVDVVADEGHFSQEEAERAAHETLDLLGRRLSEGEAMDLAPYLRGDASTWLAWTATHDAEAFSADEFRSRLADNADVSEQRAERYAGAVADALVQTVPESERERAEAQLPDQYASVLDLEG